MEHFVSIIVKDTTLDESLVESVLSSAQVGLLEDETDYIIGETDDGTNILRVGLHKNLSESESDELAENLAGKLFDLGFDNFDIEVSTTGG